MSKQSEDKRMEEARKAQELKTTSEQEKEKGLTSKQPINITGNRAPADRSPNSTEEGKRQERQKMLNEQRAKEGPKTAQKKESMFTDPRRYYQGSEYQNKLEEINEKVSMSQDREEKSKLQKELQDLNKQVEEGRKPEPVAVTTK
jgi:hypothetical protein